jgi:hypothetical protein
MNDDNLKEIHMQYRKKGGMFYLGYVGIAIFAMLLGYIFTTRGNDKAFLFGCLFIGAGIICILCAILLFVIESTPSKSITGKVMDKPGENICIIQLSNGMTERFISNKGIYLIVNDEGTFTVRGYSIIGFDGYRRDKQ